MIVVQGWVRLSSMEEAERLRADAIAMMRATQAQEPGCLAYSYATDLEDRTLLNVIERWQDDEALAAHFATPHMAWFGTAMAGAQVIAASVQAYDSTELRTLMER